MYFIVQNVANIAESWHSRSVAEGHLMSNCDGEDTVLCSSMVPAVVQQPTERNLMRSYEDARDPVIVN